LIECILGVITEKAKTFIEKNAEAAAGESQVARETRTLRCRNTDGFL
jgi:hypothetical protein